MIQLATPISHLFEDEEYRQVIMRNSDILECRDRSVEFNYNIESQVLFHCELQPIHNWGSAEWHYIEKIKDSKPNLRLITFHAASCCDKPKIVDRVFQPGGKVYSRSEMLACAQKNFSDIRKILGSEIDIAIENNNYYPTDAYKYVTDADFITDIVIRNNLNFLFDIAHARVTCFNRNISFEDYKNKLPLHKAIQLHICSFDIDTDTGTAYDAHNPPDEEELLEVGRCISEYQSIQYLTVEYYRDLENLEESLKKVRRLL